MSLRSAAKQCRKDWKPHQTTSWQQFVGMMLAQVLGCFNLHDVVSNLST
ncbi:DUF4372 domain-containing protein [Sedimenticola selenatireducens]